MDGSQSYLDESRSKEILAGAIVPIAIATIFVYGRLYSRLVILGNWGADDSWILGSWIITVALTAVNCSMVMYGSGRHITFVQLHPEFLNERAKLAFVSRILYQTVLGTTKIGTCELYVRVFQDQKSKIIIRCMEAFVAIYTGALLISIFFRCSYIPDAWTAGGALRTCHTAIPGLYTSAACNILIDILLTAFAVPRIWPLKLPRTQKITLLCIVLLSTLVAIAAIVNLVHVIRATTSQDITWESINITTWSAVEIGTGLFCTCAPAMKPIIRKIAPNLLYSLSGTRNGATSHGQRGTGYATNSGMSHSRRVAVNQSIELSSQSELGIGKQGYIMNTFWRGDDESIKLSDGDSERGVLHHLKDGPGKKVEIMKTVTLKVEEHGVQ